MKEGDDDGIVHECGEGGRKKQLGTVPYELWSSLYTQYSCQPADRDTAIDYSVAGIPGKVMKLGLQNIL